MTTGNRIFVGPVAFTTSCYRWVWGQCCAHVKESGIHTPAA